MAEVLDRPQTQAVPVNNTGNYVYPYAPYYAPEPYQTTFVPKTHHYPFEHARHSLSHALHDVTHSFGPDYYPPRSDVRESKTAYYVDIELPGAESKKDIALKWINTSTLFIEANLKRPATAEDQATSATTEKGVDGPVHLVTSERRPGKYARAFAFPVKVDQDGTTAKLAYGVVRLVVPKKEEEHGDHKHVDIEHAGH